MKSVQTQKSNLFSAATLLALSAFLTFGATTDRAHAPRSAVATGQPAPSFTSKTIDGKQVNFPADYKGKVVLLDFWATWCGPCRAELPKVVAAYSDYHGKGFEVLSVSMDKPQQGPALLGFFKDNKMTWPQIYDGLASKGPIPALYGVHAIPCPVLVDGDTGNIIACDTGALGRNLTNAVAKALAGKSQARK